jgi:hypothetical protein
MSYLATIGVINYLLALLAAVIAVGILLQVSGGLATSWRILLIAFQVLAIAELFDALRELGVNSIGNFATTILYYGAQTVFIVIALVALWYQYVLIKRIGKKEAEWH